MPKTEADLIAAADELLAQGLPVPAERRRLRKAHGLTQAAVAEKFGVSRETVHGWESGRTEPRPAHRRAYAHLLRGLADRYPADDQGEHA